MGYLGSLLKGSLLMGPISHLLEVQTLMINLVLVIQQASEHLRTWAAGKQHSSTILAPTPPCRVSQSHTSRRKKCTRCMRARRCRSIQSVLTVGRLTGNMILGIQVT